MTCNILLDEINDRMHEFVDILFHASGSKMVFYNSFRLDYSNNQGTFTASFIKYCRHLNLNVNNVLAMKCYTTNTKYNTEDGNRFIITHELITQCITSGFIPAAEMNMSNVVEVMEFDKIKPRQKAKK